MNIKILGTGCPNCQKLETNTKQALSDLKMEAKLEKITDMEQIMKYGVMSLPAIVVDEKVLSYGVVLSAEEVKKILSSRQNSSSDSAGCCSCGHY